MTTKASQITSLTIVYSTVYSDADQRKHQNSASLAFLWGIHRDRWIPLTKGQLRGKCFHLMTSPWSRNGWVNILSMYRLPVCRYHNNGNKKHSLYRLFNTKLFIPWTNDGIFHYSDVIMGAMSSQMTGVSIVCTTVCSGADQRKHQSSASLAFVRGIHRSQVNSPHKGPVTGKLSPLDDVIMRNWTSGNKFLWEFNQNKVQLKISSEKIDHFVRIPMH